MIDVSKIYHLGKTSVNALKNISLSIACKEFVVIAGPSGSGKTTLLNLIGCLDTCSNGTVFVSDENVAELSDNELSLFRARKIGFIFQAFNLIPVLNVFENVEYPLTLTKTPAQERKERVYEMVDKVGLSKQITQRPNELSGGQRQRVAIARALVTQPELVLADEPTANLDSKTGSDILELMHTMNELYNTTFIFSTHDKMVMDFAEKKHLLHDGELVS